MNLTLYNIGIEEMRKQRKAFVDYNLYNIPKEPGDVYGIVYIITNSVDGKSYIGSTIDYPERAASYIRKYRNPKNQTVDRLIHQKIREYGIDKFTMKPIYLCNSKESLRRMEGTFINVMGTMSPNGYNTLDGAPASTLKADHRRNKSTPMIAISLVNKKVYFSDSGSLIAAYLFDGADRSIITASNKKGIQYRNYYFFYWNEEEIRNQINRKVDRYSELKGKRSGCITRREEEYKMLGEAILEDGFKFLLKNEFTIYRLKFSDNASERYEVEDITNTFIMKDESDES